MSLQQAISFHQAGRLADAERLYLMALKLQPNDCAALYFFGILRCGQGRFAEAVESFGKVLALQPHHADTLIANGGALRELGRFAEALASYDKASTQQPRLAELFYNRGLVLLNLARIPDAVADFTRAVEVKPGYADAWNNRGGALHSLGRFEDAIADFDRAVALQPNFATAHHNRGLSLRQLGRLQEAVASHDRALTLQPNHAEAWNDRGQALKTLRRFTEAVASLRQAITLNPKHVKARYNLGATFWDMGRIDDAAASFGEALAIDPDCVVALHARGNMLWTTRQLYEPASQDLQKALRLEPDHAYTRGDLMHVKMYGADWRDFAEEVTKIDEGVRQGKRIINAFTYLTISESVADLQICAEAFAEGNYPAVARLPVKPGRPPGKIRIGYMCGEFRDHATMRLMAGLFELHDKDRFEIVAFDTGHNDQSPLRRRVEAAFTRFVDISALNTLDAAKRVRNEGIDILVTLNGYCGEGRMDVFAQRPAPVQVNFLAFPGTLGAPYMDYVIADRIVVPEDEQKFYTEKVAYLPDSYQVNDGARGMPEKTTTRVAHNLPEDAFVFCHFNHSFKLTPSTFARWMRILRQVDGSVLWLLQSNSAFADNLRREAEQHGVAAERLIFAPVMNYQDHLARLPLGDLFLDSLPYTAHTTASDALWMGLPVLTCRGTTFAGRVAASLLSAVGLPELVTEDAAAYEVLALDLARNPTALAALRQRLAQNRTQAALFDTARYTRHLEAAYTTMLETWENGAAPHSFSVPA